MKRPPSQAAVSFVLAIADEISLGIDGNLRCNAADGRKVAIQGRSIFISPRSLAHSAAPFLLECVP